jgi:hypothetical protein
MKFQKIWRKGTEAHSDQGTKILRLVICHCEFSILHLTKEAKVHSTFEQDT